jgi:hypothetical protein
VKLLQQRDGIDLSKKSYDLPPVTFAAGLDCGNASFPPETHIVPLVCGCLCDCLKFALETGEFCGGFVIAFTHAPADDPAPFILVDQSLLINADTNFEIIIARPNGRNQTALSRLVNPLPSTCDNQSTRPRLGMLIIANHQDV